MDHGSAAAPPSLERRFYTGSRAFGRFGMRIFAPRIMEAAHWHGHIEANFLTGARMVYDHDGTRVDIPEARLVIFWAGVPHRLTALRPAGPGAPRLANMYIPVDVFLFLPHIAELQVALLSGAIAVLPGDLCGMTLMRRWYRDYRARDYERLDVLKMEFNALLRRGLVEGICYLREPITGTGERRELSSTNIRHVVTMVRYILDHLAEPIRTADIAAATGLHGNYAISLFSRTMRVPVKTFVTRLRLLRARALLTESSMAIAAVAEQSGFTSLSQFYAQFKAAYGLAPNALRQRYTEMTLR